MAEQKPKKVTFNIYVTAEERERLRSAAEADGLLLATWSRRTLLKAIEK